MKIVVLAGGLCPERDVSLSSGSLIANALLENGHRVLLLDLYTGAPLGNAAEDLFIGAESARRYAQAVPEAEPDLERLREESGRGDSPIGENVTEICRLADLVFLALHGDVGENGKLQAFFDLHGIRYTGTGCAGSLLAMDKDIAKRLMRNRGIRTPDWVMLSAGEDGARRAAGEIGFPCVAKPRGCGSSIGVSIVQNEEELDRAVAAARKYEEAVMLEKWIAGREFSVGILGSAALPAIEIIPNEGFYDYKNKYQKGRAREVCPAELDEETAAYLRDCALEVHAALGLGSYSRVDFILDGQGRAFCLEANTLPGMTPTSLLPQEAAAAGISYNELCERIALLAFAG